MTDPHVIDPLAGLRTAAVELTAVAGRRFDEVLEQIVGCAVALVGPAVAGGISIGGPGVARRPPAGHEDARALEHVQTALCEGPGVTAVGETPAGGYVHAPDLAGDDRDRWPSFAPRAVTLGYRSALSLHVPGSPGLCPVITLYARGPHAFDDVALLAVGLFGLQVATLLHGLHEAEGVRRALETRDVIGQAKGVLVERLRCSDAEAFRLLVETSRQTSTKLVAVACELVEEARQIAEDPSRGSSRWTVGGGDPTGAREASARRGSVGPSRSPGAGIRAPRPGPRPPRGGAWAG